MQLDGTAVFFSNIKLMKKKWTADIAADRLVDKLQIDLWTLQIDIAADSFVGFAARCIATAGC